MKQELIGSVYSANREAELVYQTALTTNKNIVVTGIAGTGKTSLMKRILSNSEKESVMLNGDNDPSGATVVAYFDILWWCYFHDDDAVDRIIKRYTKEKISEIKKINVLILDDVFGIALTTIVTIEKILRKIRGNWLPFGGVQMIYCGDWNNRGFSSAYRIENSDKDFFFESFAFMKSDHVFIELKKNYVFTDQNYLKVMQSVRSGESIYLPLINSICLRSETDITDGIRISHYQSLCREARSIGLSGQLVVDNDCFGNKGMLYQVLRKAKSLSQITLTHEVKEDDVVLNKLVKAFLKKLPK